MAAADADIGKRRRRLRPPLDVMVFWALLAVLVAVGLSRREFNGDGIRHLPVVLTADSPQLGEGRWLLHPIVVFLLVKPLQVAGFVGDEEGAVYALLCLTFASAALYLASLRRWLEAEQLDARRRAAALLLSGASGAFIVLYTDVAEPLPGAALIVAAMAAARIRRDSPSGVATAAIAALVVGLASLTYQGLILGLGLLPLAAGWRTLTRPVVIGTCVVAAGLLPLTAAAAGVLHGRAVQESISAAVTGEANPLTKRLMARSALPKYAAAMLAGPPQGIVALQQFTGLPAVAAGVFHQRSVRAAMETARLVFGISVILLLTAVAVRHRMGAVAIAAAALLLLPLLRNQQYSYAKFYILWPVLVGIVAARGRMEIMGATALLVLASNLLVVGNTIVEGRKVYAESAARYRAATRETCFVVAAWEPPVPQIWPGRTVGIMAILATGTEPEVQRRELTRRLTACFCGAPDVWTDLTNAEIAKLMPVLRHFDYGEVDLAATLGVHAPSPGHDRFFAYSPEQRTQVCRTLQTSHRQ